MQNCAKDFIDGKIKIKDYLKIKLSECEVIIKKYKLKRKKINYLYYSLIITSATCCSLACIFSALVGIPIVVVTVFSALGGFSTALGVVLKLTDHKNKLNNKINELNKIRNYIQYVEILNGDLTEEKINEILNNV